MSLYTCLRKVITELETTDLIDDSVKKEITESLETVLNNTKLTDEQMKAKMTLMLQHHQDTLVRGRIIKAANKLKQEFLEEELATYPEEMQASVLRNKLENSSAYNPTTTTSISARIRAEENVAIGKLHGLFNRLLDKRMPWLKETPYASIFEQELRGIDTGNTQVKADVKLFREVVAPYLKTISDNGSHTQPLHNWGPQTHSPSKIINDTNYWREFLYKHLDREYHPDPESTIEHVWKTIQTRHLEEPDGPIVGLSRQIHFDTPEAEIEYFHRFGEGPLSETLMHTVRALARRSVLIEAFGPSAKNNVTIIAKRLEKQAALKVAEAKSVGDKKAEKIWKREERHAAWAQRIIASETGSFQTPANYKLANFMGAARQWMVTQFLGFVATMIATQDMPISIAGMRFHTGGTLSAIGEQMRNFATIVGNDTARHWAEEMGVWTHTLHAVASNRFATPFGAAEKVRGLAGQAAMVTQRLAGSYTLERCLRSATMMTLCRSMARMSKLDWIDLHPKYRKVLMANGWTEGKWRQFKSVAQIDSALGTIDVMSLPADLREHTLSYLYRELDLAVIYPQHYDRVILTMGGQAGTFTGELAAIATQFWSWPIAFIRGPLRRELAMGGAGFVGFCAAMMVSGVITTQMYAALKNEPMYEWDSPYLWARAAARSGLLTPLGELVLNTMMYKHMDLGPLGGQFDGIVSTIGKAGMDIMTGQAEKIARPIAQMGKDLLIPNIWWTEFSLTSRAMDYIMEEIDPQYMRERERRWRKQGRE